MMMIIIITENEEGDCCKIERIKQNKKLESLFVNFFFTSCFFCIRFLSFRPEILVLNYEICFFFSQELHINIYKLQAIGKQINKQIKSEILP